MDIAVQITKGGYLKDLIENTDQDWTGYCQDTGDFFALATIENADFYLPHHSLKKREAEWNYGFMMKLRFITPTNMAEDFLWHIEFLGSRQRNKNLRSALGYDQNEDHLAICELENQVVLVKINDLPIHNVAGIFAPDSASLSL